MLRCEQSLQRTQWSDELTSRLSKGKSLGLISVLVIAAFIFSGQDWFLVSMAPNDEAVILKNFDGYTAFAWLSPLLLVCLAAVLTTAISVNRTRVASLAVGLLAGLGLATLSLIGVLGQDLSGVAKQIEAATGIAATHGITDLLITTQPSAWLAIGVFLLIGLAFAAAIRSQRAWVVKQREASKAAPENDSISLWDEQR